MSLPREEAVTADLACFGSGMTTVGLLEKESDAELLVKLTELDLKYLFTDSFGVEKLARILNSGASLPLKKIIAFDELRPEHTSIFESALIETTQFTFLLKDRPCYLFKEPDPKSYCLYAYTNGTTGKSKLVKFTHEDLISCLTPIVFQSFDLRPEDVYVLYTNLALFGERIMLYTLVIYGVSVGFSQALSEDLPILQPTILLAIPRVLEFIQRSIKRSVSLKSGLSEKIFTKCLNSSLAHFNRTGSLPKNLFNKIAFSSIREKFGSRLRILLTGSSPSNPDTVNFIQICLGAEIYEGYGSVETGYSNLYGRNSMLRPLIGTQAKLEYLPEINIEGLEKTKYGELCIRLDHVNTANNEKKWIRTGDLFFIDQKNFGFKFLERVCYCVQVLSGWTVFPQRLELVYRQNPLVAQIFIAGDKRIDGVIAVVVVDENVLRGYWGKSFLLEELKGNEILVKEICLGFDRIAVESKLKQWELVLGVVIETEPWTSSELVTGSLKLKRHRLREKYEESIEVAVSRIQSLGAIKGN